jgi:hypothetical protein
LEPSLNDKPASQRRTGVVARCIAIEGLTFVVLAFAAGAAEQPAGLSAAEFDVLRSLLRGESNAQVQRAANCGAHDREPGRIDLSQARRGFTR